MFFFFFGSRRSATGKSTLLKQLVSGTEKKTNLYLVNVKGEETVFYEKKHPKTLSTTFAGIKNIKKYSLIIVEDLISMKKEEEINLRNAVNYTVHHRQSKLFCVSHTITRTGIYSMVGLFNYIIFTGSASNIPVIRVCLRYFKIENEIVNKWLTFIKKHSRKTSSNWDPYYFFDCTKMVFYTAANLLTMSGLEIIGDLHDYTESDDDDDDDDDDDADDENFSIAQSGRLRRGPSNQKPPLSSSDWLKKTSKEKRNRIALKKKREWETCRINLLKTNFAAFFQGHQLQSQASAIFAIIADKFGATRIDPVDLSISFQKNNLKSKKKISTVDYVASLLLPEKKPPLDHLVLHNFVSKNCIIPISCIRNKNFLGMNRY